MSTRQKTSAKSRGLPLHPREAAFAPSNGATAAKESRFWFRPVSAAGFGFMRIGFGITALATLLMQWQDVGRLYGGGILPREMAAVMLRSDWRFTILEHIPAQAVFPLYLVLLAALVMTMIGYRTKLALFVSVVLLFSFDEYSVYALNGGDTMLRILGFLLLISPCDRALSLDNLLRRYRLSHETGKDQDPAERTMPVWPYRLLLWQVTLLYISSALYKFSGTTWAGGSAVAIALHHPGFTQLSPGMADLATWISPALCWFVLLVQSAWVLMLIVPLLGMAGIPRMKALNGPLKRMLLAAGGLVHVGIALTMNVGMFSFVMLTAYLGLLLDDDFRTIRRAFNRFLKGKKVTVLFDGRCGFCRGSVLLLKMMDFLHRLEFVNFYDTPKREAIAPGISLPRLQQAMHIKNPGGRFFMGFPAFRELAWHLPPLRIVAPLLYAPGVKALGDAVYAWVAVHRVTEVGK